MTIPLPGHREQFVRELIRSGRFASEAEVVDKALQLLEASDEQARLADLRREIAIGVEQADRGELAPFDPQATLARIRSRQAKTSRPVEAKGDPVTLDELHRRMLADGLLSHFPDDAQDIDDDPDDEPVMIEGEPLSETIIRERR